MGKDVKIEPCVVEAILKLEDYIEKATGVRPEQKEIADALSKYFVLREIHDFIKMSRQAAT